MKKIMNITTSTEDLSRYLDNADLKSFYRGFGLDGLEIMQIGSNDGQIIQNDDVVGCHLKYFTSWMDLWMVDTSRLYEEFDDINTIEHVFGGTTKEALIEAYKLNLDFAAAMSPEYLVFHVSDCTMIESMKRQYHYSDKQVVEATAELVNCITDFIKGTPILLFENLWYPGLTMKSPDITKLLLEKVSYPKKGVMLDIGHLLHTNTGLETIEGGVDYVLSVLEQYEDISFIKGIHLHQTLSGEYARKLMKQWEPLKGGYLERYWDILTHIYQIDSHQPFASPSVNKIIQAVSPEYLVLEQVSSSREAHAKMLLEQMKYL